MHVKLALMTQWRQGCSSRPSSRATAPTLWLALTLFSASALNSAVYSCFGLFNFLAPSNFPEVLYTISWKTKFRGKLS